MCFTNLSLCLDQLPTQAVVLLLVLAAMFGTVSVVDAQTQSAPSRPLAKTIRVMIKSPCFDRDSLADAVEQWLGRNRLDARVTRIHVRASQGTLTFSVELAGHETMEREFPDLPRDCAAQRSALGLSIAMAVEALETDLPPAEPPVRPLWQLAVHGVMTTALPASPAWGGGVTLEHHLGPSLGVRLGVLTAVAPNQPITDALPTRFDAWLSVARAEGCVRRALSPVWVMAGCGGLWVGTLRTAARGSIESSRQAEAWWAASVSLELRVEVRPNWGMQLGLDLLAPLRGASARVLDSQGEIAGSRSLPSVVSALRLGPVLSF